jgi:hypothetical protein
MTYTPAKPDLTPSSEELRARIPGWGVDLDPKDRPSVPKLQFHDDLTGGHWEFPDRQPEKWPRERSIEHEMLTPVFGTACRPKGASGLVRRYAYRRFSEGRAAHWLLLLMADRVDAWESHLASFTTLHPDNPVTETGIGSEITHHGFRSRVGHNRVDVKHQWLDPVIVAGPWVAGVAAVVVAGRRVARR